MQGTEPKKRGVAILSFANAPRGKSSGSGQSHCLFETGQDLTDLQFPLSLGIERLAELVEALVAFAGDHIVEGRDDLAFFIEQFHMEPFATTLYENCA